MTDKYQVKQVDKNLLRRAEGRDIQHDKKPDTKPVGYFMDAWYRFSRNKGSIVAAILLLLLGLYAIIVPMVSPYDVRFNDPNYTYALPKCELFAPLGFWDGTTTIKGANQANYDYYSAIPGALVEVLDSYEIVNAGRTSTVYDLKVDSYAKVGWRYVYLTPTELAAAQAYEQQTGVQLFYPLIDSSKIKCQTYSTDANAWYLHTNNGKATYDADGNLQEILLKDEESPDGYLYFRSRQNGTQYEARVLYSDWYAYKNGRAPEFYFGVDTYGKDIFTCLGVGARVSFLIGISVSVINFLIGTIWGSIEGYYGGYLDLFMERICDILYQMPFVVVTVLFQMYLGDKVGPIGALLFAYVLTGWIGTAATVRMQFYRYKGQEYVLAARTLGSKDRHLMFKHILPNALGTIVTSSVLMIPSAIFSESFLSYMGLINLESSNLTSIGTMLSNGQSTLSTYPHCIFFPALFISLMMISFNIFGNGLRDAFNPSLRGSEG